MDNTAITNAAAEALRAQVRQAETTIRQASEACWAAQRATEKVRDTAQAPAQETLAALKEAHQARALQLAIEAGDCPRGRWGGYLDPDDVDVQERGICLSWDINGDYAPASFFVTWGALLAPVNSKGDQA